MHTWLQAQVCCSPVVGGASRGGLCTQGPRLESGYGPPQGIALMTKVTRERLGKAWLGRTLSLLLIFFRFT